jgi:hypothetical protein
MDRSGNPAAPADEIGRGESVYSHDRGAAKQAAEFDYLTHVATGHRNDPNSRSFVVHYANGHFIGDDSGNRFR